MDSPYCLPPILYGVLLISLFFPSSSLPSPHYGNSTAIGFSFSARLIHRDSVRSPFYNPNLTKSDRIQAAIRRSSSRQRYIQSLLNSKGKSPNEVQSPVRSGAGEYFMSYYIGTPPTETFATIDTGSSLIWLQCLPCEQCFPQSIPIFDPNKSSSYEKIKCRDRICHFAPTVRCDKDGESCEYGIAYGDSSSTEGILSTETLIFGDHRPDNRPANITIYNMIFGCGHRNDRVNVGDNAPAGIVGLNRNALSLPSQLLMDYFSYCLTPWENLEAQSLIHFGLSAVIDGSPTPILNVGREDLYYLSLEGISVSDERLAIPPGTFDVKPDGDGGFIIDSGATCTYLNVTAFTMLMDAVAKKMALTRGDDPNKNLDLCYKSSLKDILSAPKIAFHFSGVKMELAPLNAWVDMGDGLFCLAMKSTNGLSVFGNHQQQNINVGYDLNKKIVSFKSMDCTKA